MAHISETAPLQIDRFYTGLYTYRNPLIVPIRQYGRRIIQLYDAISSGLNMEVSNKLTLIRRPGWTVYNTIAVNGRALFFYAFKPANFSRQIYTIADTTVDLEWIQPGDIPPVPLLDKTTPAKMTFAQVAAYLYIASQSPSVPPGTAPGTPVTSSTNWKWDSPQGVQGVTKWGIDINDANESAGPNNLPAMANLPLSQSAPAWTTAAPFTVTLPAAIPTSTVSSQWALFTGAGFHLADPPPPYVTGVEITINGLETAGQGISLNVGLTENGALIGDSESIMLPSNQGTVIAGRPSDMFNTNIQPHDVNQSTFGVAIQAVNRSQAPATYTIQSVQIAVFLQGGPPVALTGGTINAAVGYQYVYCYGNSYSGHISSPSFPSVYNSGNNPPLIQPVNQGVNVTATSSPDPQVTHIHFYRTTDGGGGQFFELPNSPLANGASGTTVTILDNAEDWQLQIAEIAPLSHFNDPPPQGAEDPVWFGGRLWMHKGNLLFFASGPDITQGNQQEAWFPPYVFEIPHAEIIRKFPTPNGMLVITIDNIYIVRGNSTFSFTVTDFMLDTGMRSWYAADTDGTNIYIYTSDRQLLLINANGLSSISQNIADSIQEVDPSLARAALFRYQAQQNWLMLTDGERIVFPYNVELQAWGTPAEPVNGIGALSTVETTPGVFQLWRARPVDGSLISFRDVNSWLDEGIAYPCHAIFGPIPIADFLTLAQVRDIVLAWRPTSTHIMVSGLANEILPVADKQYQVLEITSSEPPELSATPSLSYFASRWTWKSVKIPELANLIFMRIDFDAQDNPDELYNWTVGGTQTTGGSSMGAPGQLPQLQGR